MNTYLFNLGGAVTNYGFYSYTFFLREKLIPARPKPNKTRLVGSGTEAALAGYEESLTINPIRMPANVYKIIILYHMGRIVDAKWQMDQLVFLYPGFDAQVWADRQPFSDRRINKSLLHNLKQDGLAS